jgi:hypothetical protein
MDRASGGGVKRDREGVSAGRTNKITFRYRTKSTRSPPSAASTSLQSQLHHLLLDRTTCELSDDRGGWLVMAPPHRIEAQ